MNINCCLNFALMLANTELIMKLHASSIYISSFLHSKQMCPIEEAAHSLHYDHPKYDIVLILQFDLIC